MTKKNIFKNDKFDNLIEFSENPIKYLLRIVCIMVILFIICIVALIIFILSNFHLSEDKTYKQNSNESWAIFMYYVYPDTSEIKVFRVKAEDHSTLIEHSYKISFVTDSLSFIKINSYKDSTIGKCREGNFECTSNWDMKIDSSLSNAESIYVEYEMHDN